MSKHSLSKRMKDKEEDKGEVQEEEEVELKEEEEEVHLEEVEEESRILKVNQLHHQGGDTPEEEPVEVRIREICNVIIVINLAILSMNVDQNKQMKGRLQIMEKKNMVMVKNNCSYQ